MKLACASTAFDLRLESGDLTQLEWLDLCARELAADGVVCDVRHFPRRDSDYLAQVKKMAVDLGLVIAAVSDAEFFGGDEASMREVLAVADVLGAPIVAAPLEIETATSWSAELERIGVATSMAKTMNVTLAVRNRPQTFGATSHDLKRVSKEADSAWLRFALEYEAFDAASNPQALIARTVLLWHAHQAGVLEGEQSPTIDRMLQDAKDFRGFLVVDAAGGKAGHEMMHNEFRRWRTILAKAALGEAL